MHGIIHYESSARKLVDCLQQKKSPTEYGKFVSYVTFLRLTSLKRFKKELPQDICTSLLSGYNKAAEWDTCLSLSCCAQLTTKREEFEPKALNVLANTR